MAYSSEINLQLLYPYFYSQDFQFIFGNKISHIIGWTQYSLNINMEDQGIHYMNLIKQNDMENYPTYSQIQEVQNFIQKAKDQCLCCLIYSEKQSDASLIMVSYLMQKFKWNLNTSWNFLRLKIEMPNICQSLWEQLLKMELEIIKMQGQLKRIVWNYQQLINYICSDDQQLILINTVKNSLSIPYNANTNRKLKTKKRVEWYDKIKYNSQKSINNYQRPTSCLKKYPKQFYTKINKKVQNNKRYKRPIMPRSFKQQMDKQFLDECEEQPLKQLSNTNFQEFLVKRRVLKKTSLKQSNSEKSLLSNKFQSPKKPLLSINTINANSFLNSLKTLTKQPFNLYA